MSGSSIPTGTPIDKIAEEINFTNLTYDQLVVFQHIAELASQGQEDLMRKAAFDSYGDRAEKAWRRKKMADELVFRIQMEKAKRVKQGHGPGQANTLEDIMRMKDQDRG